MSVIGREGQPKDEIPTALRTRLSSVLSIATPNNYFFVSNAVKNHNQSERQTVDPISVAHQLMREGFKIVGIPERDAELRPNEQGLLTTKQEIARVVAEDRVGEFPVLDAAILLITRGFFFTDDLRELARQIKSILETQNTLEDPSSRLSDIFNRPMTVKILLKYKDKKYEKLSDADLTALAEKTRLQMKIILEHFKTKDELTTKSEKSRVLKNIAEREAAVKEERHARDQELLTDREAAEAWLFGTARAICEKKGWNTDFASEELGKVRRAGELVSVHKIHARDFIAKQCKNERERSRNHLRSQAWETALSTILITFDRPRTAPPKTEMVRDPNAYLLSLIRYWNGAHFVSELPVGMYPKLVAELRARTAQGSRRSYDDDWDRDRFRDPELKKLLDDAEKADAAKSAKHYDSYLKNRAAVLWWELPDWRKWKAYREPLRDMVRGIQRSNRSYTPQTFSSYLGTLISQEERRMAVASGRSPLLAHARIKELKDIKSRFDLDFVLSKEERDAEITRLENERLRERSRYRIRLFDDEW